MFTKEKKNTPTNIMIYKNVLRIISNAVTRMFFGWRSLLEASDNIWAETVNIKKALNALTTFLQQEKHLFILRKAETSPKRESLPHSAVTSGSDKQNPSISSSLSLGIKQAGKLKLWLKTSLYIFMSYQMIQYKNNTV